MDEATLIAKGYLRQPDGSWSKPCPHSPAPLRPPEPQRPGRVPLEQEAQRNAAGRARFTICFTIYSCRPCDWDNYYTKSLQDCLRAAGYFPDDDWQTLQGRVISCKAHTKAEERTVINIMPLLPV